MNDLIDGVRHEGDIRIDGTSLYDPSVEVISLRKRVGMVFQKYNPFAKSIYENVVFSLRVAGRSRKSRARRNRRALAAAPRCGTR
jgi:phosphate transport system ATP-binding protein